MALKIAIVGIDQLWTHEEYDAGCLVEAGVHYYPELPAKPEFHAGFRPDLLGGEVTITTQDVVGNKIFAIPYYAWDSWPVVGTEGDWLTVWLRQQDWFNLRQPMDENDRQRWKHILYQPLPDR